MKVIWACIGLSVCLGLPMGCGNDDDFPDGATVGAPCQGDGDCVERCVRGGDWPGGMCTLRCSHDGDCPSGTACIDKEGGICAVTCGNNANCADFGSGWHCDTTGRKGASGQVAVCRG